MYIRAYNKRVFTFVCVCVYKQVAFVIPHNSLQPSELPKPYDLFHIDTIWNNSLLTWTKVCFAVHCHRPCSPSLSYSFHHPYIRHFDCKGRGKPEYTKHRSYSHEKMTAGLPQITDLGILSIFSVNCLAFFLCWAYLLLLWANKKAIGLTGYSMTKKRSHGHNDTWTNKRQGNLGTR